MKKVILFVCLLLVFSLCLSAETLIEVVEETDEWGDSKGSSFLFMYSDDFKFSNSYSANDDGYGFFLCFYPEYKIVCGAALKYEWSGASAVYYMDDEIIVKYRDENKNVTEVKTKPEYNEAALFTFLQKPSEELIKTMKNSDKIQFIVKGTEYEKGDQYNVVFEYDHKDFAAKLKEIGW